MIPKVVGLSIQMACSWALCYYLILSFLLFLLQVEMDSPQDMEHFVDELLLRSTKEHLENQTEKLINYFGEEIKHMDPLTLVGKRYKDKQAEYDTVCREKDELLIKTKHLNDELQKLRASLNDSGIRPEDLRLSLDRTEKQENNTSSKQMTRTLESHNISVKNSLQNLEKSLQETRENYVDYAKQYDRLVEYLFSYLSREKSLESLRSEMKEVSKEGDLKEGDEMVLVPRKRYEKLVEIYSINIAEISINEVREKLKITSGVSEGETRAINYVEENKKNYKEKYSDIARDENIDIKDLYQFFGALARKAGFEKEWERYHSKNANEAVAFKTKIDSILSQKIDSLDAGNVDESSPQINQKLKKNELVGKMDKLIFELSFARQEKQEWKNLKTKIINDELLDITKVVEKFEETLQKQHLKTISDLANLMSASITRFLQHFSKVISTRLRTKPIDLTKSLEEITPQNLKQAMEQKSTSLKDVWQKCEEVTQQKINLICKKLSKSIFFISSRALQGALASKN